MMKKFILLVLLAVCTALWAQELSPQFASDNPEVDRLCAEAKKRMLAGNNIGALETAGEAKKLALHSGKDLATAKANATFAWVFLDSNNFDAAESFAKKALKLIEPESQPEAAAALYHQLGIIFDKKLQTKPALKNYLLAARVYKELGNPRCEVQVYVEISRLYLMSNDVQSFQKYYSLSREMLKKYPSPKFSISLNNQQNMLLMDAKKFQQAYDLNMETAAIGEKFGYKKDVGAAYYNAAGALFEMGKVNVATQMVDRAIAYNRTNGLPYADHLVGKSQILLSQGKAKDAEAMLASSVADLHKNKDRYMEMKARKMLADLYKKTGQSEKAAAEFMTYKNLEDSISSAKQAVALKEVEYRYKDEEKEKLLDSYRKSSVLKSWILGLVGALGLMSLYLVYNSRKNLRLRQHYFDKKEKLLEAEKLNAFREKELAKKEEEKAILNQKLLEEEQGRLTAEKQNTDRELASIALYVQEKNKMLEELQQKMDVLLQESNDENREKLLEISRNVKQGISFEKDWDKIKLHFEKVHPEFFTKLSERFPTLTQNELKHCAYIKMNMANKETANLLGVDYNTVKMSRYRIKKKLNLAAEEDLTRFVQNI